MLPWLSVVVPTIGRPSVRTTLESYARQQNGNGSPLEVLVVVDVFGDNAPAQQTRDQVGDLLWIKQGRTTYRYIEHDGGRHCWGHPQRTEGARQASAPWVAFSQDDDIAAAGALEAIHAAVGALDRPRPLFFRTRVPHGGVVWGVPQLALGNIDADCLVLPKTIAERVVWGSRYEGDYDAAVEAARLASGEVVWCDELISIARPREADLWWRSASAYA